MAFLDRVKAGATQVAQKAQEAGKVGQAKLDQVQAKRQEDSMLRDLGAAVYAERTDRGDSTTAGEIDRLVAALRAHEAENTASASTSANAGSESSSSSDEAPSGDFKLDD